jgi:5-methylcytosine-specific restriction enzyme subunit McrC
VSITVQNVYYLLCYAWDRLEARGLSDVTAVPGDRVENLLGLVLRDAVARLVRAGLDRGYETIDEEGRRVRGKILVSQTAQRMLLPRGRVACQVDELTHDVPHNRVIKAAMIALMDLPDLDRGIRSDLRALRVRMHDVSDVELTPAAFRAVHLHRNIAPYAFAVDVCRLVAVSLLPEEGTGRRRFHPFTADEREMGHLFQAFVRNFLRREQPTFGVSAPRVPWNAQEAGPESAWLPVMQTDIMLSNSSSRVVIEAKYYATPYQSHFGSRKLISGHLYQLMTYVSQLGATSGPRPIGVLLYAGPHEGGHLRYTMGEYTLLVRNVDLSCPWLEVHRQLVALAAELERLSVPASA